MKDSLNWSKVTEFRIVTKLNFNYIFFWSEKNAENKCMLVSPKILSSTTVFNINNNNNNNNFFLSTKLAY